MRELEWWRAASAGASDGDNSAECAALRRCMGCGVSLLSLRSCYLTSIGIMCGFLVEIPIHSILSPPLASKSAECAALCRREPIGQLD